MRNPSRSRSANSPTTWRSATSPARQQAGIALAIEYPDGLPLTRADAALIERALSNLLDNALRVTPGGGQVTVRALRNAGGMRLEVADTGPGVAAEDQSRVFERFYQTSRHREHRGSSGLGLAIVKRVAELHGGSVGLRSEPGQDRRSSSSCRWQPEDAAPRWTGAASRTWTWTRSTRRSSCCAGPTCAAVRWRSAAAASPRGAGS